MTVQTFDRPSTTERSDAELLAAVARRDETGMAELYDRYHLLAFSVAYRVVNDRARAEDVVQDAFLSIWRKAGTYTEGRGSVRTWLASIVRNRAIDIVRGRRGSDGDDETVLLNLHDPAPDVHDQVALRLEGRTVRTAVAALPMDQRAAIVMAYYEGRSHSEIAEATGLPLGTVKSRIRLAMHRLRSVMLDAPALMPTAHS
jgi:RNA polymerase sigma-70 factor (ECF subfamily)